MRPRRPPDRPTDRPAEHGPAPDPPARAPAGPRRTPWVTYTLIGLCVLAFLAGPVAGLVPGGGGAGGLCEQARYFARWGVVPARLWHAASAAAVPPSGTPGCGPAAAPAVPAPLSVLTAMFVHGGWTHLLGNMLFLLVFGPAVEDLVGRVRFAAFYLLSGYVATYGYAIGAAGSAQTLIGASGAIAGVLGAFLYLYPKARVTGLLPFLLFLPLRLPAWLVLGFWFALQWFASRSPHAGPGVAYLAHVIGFAFGFLCAAAAYRERRSKLAAQPATRGDSQP